MRKISLVTVITMLALLMSAALVMASPGLSGKVIETMDSGGYTYVQIEGSGGKTWFAIPKTKIKMGQKVTFQPGGAMPNFTSKTLGKTFDVIIFSPGLAK